VSAGSGFPPEVRAAITREWKDAHYRKWLDEEIPALDNQTPRHAVTLSTLRPRVIDLLKELENSEARFAGEGEIPYDFGWLWRELGVEEERR
jgi:hypothetical protein